MKYRKLGNTGLIVSEVALGTMQFGGKMNMGDLGQEDTTRMVKLALDRGINFIDTADVYSLGESETFLGNALKGMRGEIVLATKVRLPMSANFNNSGATRVNIMREVEASLRRLQTEYIDLYQVHGWDSNTPLTRLESSRFVSLLAFEVPEKCHFLSTLELRSRLLNVRIARQTKKKTRFMVNSQHFPNLELRQSLC